MLLSKSGRSELSTQYAPEICGQKEGTVSLVIKKKEYEKATEGIHSVTISKVEDLGKIETQNGVKEFVRVVFTVEDQKDKAGAKVEIFQRFTRTLGPKSNLTKFLNQLGFTPGAEFDLEDIVGTKTQIVVEHVEKDGVTYANIASVIKQRKNTSTEF